MYTSLCIFSYYYFSLVQLSTLIGSLKSISELDACRCCHARTCLRSSLLPSMVCGVMSGLVYGTCDIWTCHMWTCGMWCLYAYVMWLYVDVIAVDRYGYICGCQYAYVISGRNLGLGYIYMCIWIAGMSKFETKKYSVTSLPCAAHGKEDTWQPTV